MGVSVETETAGSFVPGAPALVFAGQYFGAAPTDIRGRGYDIAPDGQRFLLIKQGVTSTDDADDPFAGLTQTIVVQNWASELQARVPTGR